MSDKSINEQIHELIEAGCWHEGKFLPSEDRNLRGHRYVCLKCEHRFISSPRHPKYDSDLTACFNGPVEWMRKTKFLEIWINNESSDHWNVEIIPVSKADPIAVVDDASLARAICLATLAAMEKKDAD